MDNINLSGKLRLRAGRGPCNDLRKHSRIPGVLYGREHQNVLVEFSEMELNDTIKQYGEHAVINLGLNDSSIKAMIKEVQRDPVNRRLQHIDLKYLRDDERVHSSIPVVLRGEESVRSRGGVVQKQLGSIVVESSPDKLPKYVVADVSRLNIGGKFTVADIELAEDITLETDIHSIIAAVTAAKEVEKLAEGDGKVTMESIIQQDESNK